MYTEVEDEKKFLPLSLEFTSTPTEAFVALPSVPRDALAFISMFRPKYPPVLGRGRNALFDNVIIATEGPEILELTCETNDSILIH